MDVDLVLAGTEIEELAANPVDLAEVAAVLRALDRAVGTDEFSARRACIGH